jgi:hypothetical protein
MTIQFDYMTLLLYSIAVNPFPSAKVNWQEAIVGRLKKSGSGIYVTSIQSALEGKDRSK